MNEILSSKPIPAFTVYFTIDCFYKLNSKKFVTK